jgi:spore germination cell wall hydrolase CwlJ-like protein
MELTLSNDIQSRWQSAIKIVVFSLSFILVMAMLTNLVKAKMEHMQREHAYNAQYSAEPIKEKMKQLECLTRNIYWEAAGESFEGKVAVAQVTLNRVESGRFADSVCGVVFQKNVFYEKVVCQFSWYCEGNFKTRPIYQVQYKESEEVAKKVLLENFRLPSLHKALYYHADYVRPGWNKEKVATIGRHIFYKD